MFHYTRSYRGPVRGLIFDWAGTTVDFGCCAPAIVFVELFKRHGVDISLSQARGPMGMHKRDHIASLLGLDDVRARWSAAHNGVAPGEAEIDQLFAEFVPLQVNAVLDYADVIPGCIEACAEFRRRGLKIGSTTGYNQAMMDALVPEAARRGYAPDFIASVSDVPAGRPAPWMCFRNAMHFGIYPMEAWVKVGDTVPDIEEGLNAGMWTVAVVMTGNEIGLTEAGLAALAPEERAGLRAKAYDKLSRAGAHYVVDGIADVPSVLDAIDARLARGEKP